MWRHGHIQLNSLRKLLFLILYLLRHRSMRPVLRGIRVFGRFTLCLEQQLQFLYLSKILCMSINVAGQTLPRHSGHSTCPNPCLDAVSKYLEIHFSWKRCLHLVITQPVSKLSKQIEHVSSQGIHSFGILLMSSGSTDKLYLHLWISRCVVRHQLDSHAQSTPLGTFKSIPSQR